MTQACTGEVREGKKADTMVEEGSKTTCCCSFDEGGFRPPDARWAAVQHQRRTRLGPPSRVTSGDFRVPRISRSHPLSERDPWFALKLFTISMALGAILEDMVT